MGKSETNTNKQLSSLTPDTLIDLYEIDFSNLQLDFEMMNDLYGVNLGADTVYRFCPMINGVNPIVWQGKSYQPQPIRAEGFEQKADGTLSRPTLSIANPDGLFSRIVHTNKDFSNCKITRKRTYARFLDNANFQNRNLNSDNKNPFGTADSQSHLPDDIYFINKKNNENKKFIEFELVSSLELEDSPVPARIVLSDSCGWTYRCNIGCRYKGLPIETADGVSLTTVAVGGAMVDPTKYPGLARDVPEWNRYGLGGSSEERQVYTKGDVVKLLGKASSDPYRKIPHLFVCKENHGDASSHHPFFDKEYWSKDECQKTMSSCRKRFGPGLNSFNGNHLSPGLPFGAFPGTEKFAFE
tara:strand:+ start:7078 stop:8142 length:1065 start_codon:yes stop_codon:yes gene_type:complete